MAIEGVRPLTTEDVVNLLERGPACVAIDGKGRIVGYGLSRMGVPGILEITDLVMNTTTSSGETEMEMLTYLHEQGQAHNVDIGMMHCSGPWPECTPTFLEALLEAGYIPRFRYGPEDIFTELACPLSHDDLARRTPLWRYDVTRQIYLVEDQDLANYGPSIRSPGLAHGGNPSSPNFGEIFPFQVHDLRDPSVIARATEVAYMPYKLGPGFYENNSLFTFSLT